MGKIKKPRCLVAVDVAASSAGPFDIMILPLMGDLKSLGQIKPEKATKIRQDWMRFTAYIHDIEKDDVLPNAPVKKKASTPYGISGGREETRTNQKRNRRKWPNPTRYSMTS